MNTREKIAEYIKINGSTTPEKISRNINISKQMIHRHLKKLTEQSILTKNGQPPKVYYAMKDK